MKKIEELSDLMIRKRIIHCEVDALEVKNELGFTDRYKIKLMVDPSAFEKEEVKAAKPDEEFTKSDEMDDYERFIYKPDSLKEAKLRMEIDSL